MAKGGRGQQIGGAFFEIGGDNTGLKDTLDDSLRAVTGAVGALSAIGKAGAGGLAPGLGGLAGLGGAGLAANEGIKALEETQDSLNALSDAMGIQGGQAVDFQSALSLMQSATRDRPVSVGDLIPPLIDAFRRGALNPRDATGIQGFLEDVIGGSFKTGKTASEIGAAFVSAMAQGKMGGLISAGFQGINPDPRIADENLRRARAQSRQGLAREAAEEFSLSRQLRVIASGVSSAFTALSEKFAGSLGGLTFGELTDVSNVETTRALGLGGAERRQGLGGLLQDNPAFGGERGILDEDISLRLGVQNMLFRKRQRAAEGMRGEDTFEAGGNTQPAEDLSLAEIKGLLSEIRDNTKRGSHGGEFTQEDLMDAFIGPGRNNPDSFIPPEGRK